MTQYILPSRPWDEFLLMDIADYFIAKANHSEKDKKIEAPDSERGIVFWHD